MRSASSVVSRLAPLLAVIAICSLTLRGQQPAPPPAIAPRVAGELLVGFERTTPSSRRTDILRAVGAGVVRHFATLDVDHVRFPAQAAIENALARLRGEPGIRFVQPNYIRRAAVSSPPNDTYWLNGQLWGMQKISMEAEWANFTRGDGTVVIADIDTGVNYNHPDLAANMWRNPGEIPGNGIDDDGNGYIDDVYGIDTINGDSDPMDDNGHGTHTAGTIAASGNNGVGVVGVNWNAKILSCKFLDSTGAGSDAGAIACFDYVLALKNRGVNIRVTNNSWGENRTAGQYASALQDAIDAAGNAGILNVFAAGNNGTNNDTTPFDPASFTSPSIVAVAASDQADNRAAFSNYGAASVDLAAPGVSILSTYGDGYAYLSGTSMAAPHVAGAAAALAAQNPSASVAALKTYLLANVDRMVAWSGIVASGGRLNVFAAGLAASGNASPVVAAPYKGIAWPIPGTIEAENFDDGGEGVGYHDTTSGNNGGAYRATDVDIEPTSDVGGGYNVGWMTAGEWLNYTVTVAQSGTYALTARVAAKSSGGTFHIEFGGVDRTGPIAIPSTGAWQSWTDVGTTVNLIAGTQSMRFVADANGTVFGNLNYVRVTAQGGPQPFGGVPRAIPGTIQAEDFDDGGESVAYHDTSSGNKGGQYRSTDVDIELTNDAGGGYDVGWIKPGEWLTYSVSVAQSGTYTLTVRGAAAGAGGVFHIEFGGVDRTGPLVVPSTGGWQTWADVSTAVSLPAGAQSMRIVIDSNSPDGIFGNLNYVRIQ